MPGPHTEGKASAELIPAPALKLRARALSSPAARPAPRLVSDGSRTEMPAPTTRPPGSERNDDGTTVSCPRLRAARLTSWQGEGARQCAPRGGGVGHSGSPRSRRVGFGAQPRLKEVAVTRPDGRLARTPLGAGVAFLVEGHQLRGTDMRVALGGAQSGVPE